MELAKFNCKVPFTKNYLKLVLFVSLPKYYKYFNYIYNVYMCIYAYIFKTTQIKQPLQKMADSS